MSQRVPLRLLHSVIADDPLLSCLRLERVASYGLKLAAVAILLTAAGIAAIWIFEDIWTRVGLGAAIVVVVGGVLGFTWYVSRKDRQARAGVDELPDI